jgi:aminopeptidase N
LESLRYFEKNFGEYPYSTYTVAETGFCYGGMEYPALSLISDTLTGEDRARVTAHETAHQWWAITVGSDQIENAWQDEGLAEYSALTFFETYEKYGYTRESIVQESLQEYRSYYDVYGSVLGRTDTAMTRHLKEFISDYEYRCIAYDKSVIMFDTLRKSVGNEKFFDGLQRYYKENKYKNATPDGLIGAFERCGLDVRGFFESFLEGKAVL